MSHATHNKPIQICFFPENSLGIAIFASFKEAPFVAGFELEREAILLDFGGWEELNCRREVRKD